MGFMSAVTSRDARTANGALSHSTSGSAILDYFFKCSVFRNRSQEDVNLDMVKIFNEDKFKALKVVLYNRLVTRKVKFTGGETEAVQKGQGQKDEFIKSLVWLEENIPELLYKNLFLVPLVGCWHDLWYDSPTTKLNNYVDTSKVYPLIQQGLQSQVHRGLIAKYLPKIRSASKVQSDRHRRLNQFAKGFCQYMGWSERTYRKFKSNPENTAHLFQRQMCSNMWKHIDFDKVPGRALLKSMNAFDNRCGAKLETWLLSKANINFTGYPYELLKAYRKDGKNKSKKLLVNAQFDHLVNLGTEGVSEQLRSGVWCALDTSGSMGCDVANGTTALDICTSLGIYFSSMIEGEFKDNVIMFDDKSSILKLHGKFTDKVDQVPMNAMGSTNFQSVIDEIVRVRLQNPNIPVSDYPKTLLVVSDMQFNCAQGGYAFVNGRYIMLPGVDEKTNYETAMAKLTAVGLPKINIIWWNVSNYGKDVPNKMNDEGVTLLSGFDPTVVSLVLGGEVTEVVNGEVVTRKLTPLEQMDKALNQEILNSISR